MNKDSYEKIEQEMLDYCRPLMMVGQVTLREWADRLAALRASGQKAEPVAENGLLPCPFCGSSARRVDYHGQIGIRCSGACAMNSYTLPVAAWNVRARPAPAASGAALENSVKEIIKNAIHACIKNGQLSDDVSSVIFEWLEVGGFNILAAAPASADQQGWQPTNQYLKFQADAVFNLANSLAGEPYGSVAVVLHGAANCLRTASRMILPSPPTGEG